MEASQKTCQNSATRHDPGQLKGPGFIRFSKTPWLGVSHSRPCRTAFMTPHECSQTIAAFFPKNALNSCSVSSLPLETKLDAIFMNPSSETGNMVNLFGWYSSCFALIYWFYETLFAFFAFWCKDTLSVVTVFFSDAHGSLMVKTWCVATYFGDPMVKFWLCPTWRTENFCRIFILPQF